MITVHQLWRFKTVPPQLYVVVRAWQSEFGSLNAATAPARSSADIAAAIETDLVPLDIDSAFSATAHRK
jgi:anti-sigma-K factor RskA